MWRVEEDWFFFFKNLFFRKEDYMDQNLILWADESPSDRNKLKQELLPSKHLLAASYIHQIWHKSSWWTATEQQSLYAIRLDKNITKGLSFWKFDGLLLICIPGRGLRKRREDWLNWPANIIIHSLELWPAVNKR